MRSTHALLLLILVSGVTSNTVKCFSHAPIRALEDAPVVPGFSTAFSQKGIDYVKTVGIAILQKQLPNLVIPPLNGTAWVAVILSNIDYEVKDIHFQDFKLGQADVTIEKGKGGVSVNIQDSQVVGSLHWHWRREGWIHPEGTGIANFSLTTSIKMFIQFTAVDDHLHISDIPATVDISNMKIHIDSTAGWFYNFILGLFNGLIKSSIKNAVEKAFPTEITADINKALLTIPVRQQLVDPVVFDIGLVRQPLFADAVFRLFEAGDAYDKNNISKCPAEECPVVELPSDISNSRMVQMYMSDFVPNSLARAFRLAGFLQYTITPEMVPAGFPFQLTTKILAGICPQLIKAYPDNRVEIIVRVPNTPAVRFVKDVGVDVALDVDFSIMVQVGTEYVEALVIDNAIHADASVSLGGWQIYGNVPSFNITASVQKSTIGPVDIEPIQGAIKWILNYGLPSANAILRTGISLPVVPGFSIAASDIIYGQSFLSLALDLKYDPAAAK